MDQAHFALGSTQLGTRLLGGNHHIAEGRLDFSIPTGLEVTAGVDPRDVAIRRKSR